MIWPAGQKIDVLLLFPSELCGSCEHLWEMSASALKEAVLPSKVLLMHGMCCVYVRVCCSSVIVHARVICVCDACIPEYGSLKWLNWSMCLGSLVIVCVCTCMCASVTNACSCNYTGEQRIRYRHAIKLLSSHCSVLEHSGKISMLCYSTKSLKISLSPFYHIASNRQSSNSCCPWKVQFISCKCFTTWSCHGLPHSLE